MVTQDSNKMALRNPLVVFGLILIGGDGPLLAAFSLSNDPWLSRFFAISLVSFVSFIGLVFCMFLWFRPKRLYNPQEPWRAP
jgi:hypothetical protein